jgi:hypothetical protein
MKSPSHEYEAGVLHSTTTFSVLHDVAQLHIFCSPLTAIQPFPLLTLSHSNMQSSQK